MCSPTNFSDIYFGGARNSSLLSDLAGGGGGFVADPECSDHSNEESMQDWTCQGLPSSSTSTSRLFISSKYAPLKNIAPTQAYLQHNFIYRPSWEKNSKKSKYNSNSLYGNRGVPPFGFGKSKSKNKHRNTGSGQFGSSKMDGAKSKRSMMTTTLDISLKMEIGSSSNKYESTGGGGGRHMHVKEEPISDSEVRNESESDSDSDNEKKKSSKKSSHDKSSKKSDKNQKSRKSTDKAMAMHDGCLMHDNPAISDDNSNDSSHNFAAAVKSEAYHKSNVKNEMIGGPNNNDGVQQQQRGDGDGSGQAANATGNLDKSSSSVEEFDNEKPSRVVKVSINLEYDSEVYNDEVNIRRFHKYQRNMEIENTLQVTSFDSSNVITAPVQTPLAAPIGSAGGVDQQFPPYESNLPSTMLDCNMQLQLQQQMVYSSSDSDSDDSDGNDLDDSDNSSCDECASGPCSTSVLPPLQNGSPALSPAMSMSSYYNKNGEFFAIKISFSQ